MFKRDWLNGFIFGIVAGFFLTPALIFAAIAFSGAPEYLGYTNASHQSGNHATPQDQRWWLIARVVYMDDTAAQWIMTFATIFAAYLLLRTLWATQQMAAETTRIGEAQVRAYVTINEPKIWAKKTSTGTEPRFRFSVQNSGNSPALNAAVKITSDDCQNGSSVAALGSIPSAGDAMVDVYFPLKIENADRQMIVKVKLHIRFTDVFGTVIKGDEELIGVTDIPVSNGCYLGRESNPSEIVDIMHQE